MICHPFKCIFVHIPKTGGQSIELFFMQLLGLDWDSDREALYLTRSTHDAMGTEKLAHLSALEYVDRGHMSQADYAACFKFSFVRNPWTRIVSEYRYRNYFHHHSFQDFVLHKMPRPGFGDQYRHVMPQYDMLHDEQGNLLVDYVGRFETLQQDFDHICEKLGIQDSTLPHKNRSDKRSRKIKRRFKNMLFLNGENRHLRLRDYYDEQTRQAIADYYRADIEAFNYSFDP